MMGPILDGPGNTDRHSPAWERVSTDLDIWARPDPSNSNSSCTLKALADFGAPLHDLTGEDFPS